MSHANDFNPFAKVHYHPIEAAIRWSGLARQEAQILAVLAGRTTIQTQDFPKHPELKLRADLLYDAIRNRELPYGLDGLTTCDPAPAEDPRLTIRHIDLRLWMAKYYPGQKPGFLFSALERAVASSITLDAVNNLVNERDTFRALARARAPAIAVRPSMQPSPATPAREEPSAPLGPRGETTYLNIVGGLLHLLLGHAPSGQPYSSFHTQESVISALLAHHGGRLGISERTLQTKFAAAKRALDR